MDGLRSGRTAAVESEPVQPVSRSAVEAVERHVLPAVWTMIRLQLATGMRPGEARTMRLADIDRSGEVLEYVPAAHKTQHRGKQRRIYIGPTGQEILAPYLKAEPEQFLFESSPGECCSKDSYNRAVSRACKRAGIEPWSPNQLRHTAATEIRKRFGLEASRVILGHSSAETTLIYAERDFEAAKSVIRQMG